METENLLETRLTLRPLEAAQVLGISRAALYRLLHEGEIHSHRVGGKRMIAVKELRRWVDALR